MGILPYCPHDADHELRITWVNPTGPQDTGPICATCAAALWGTLTSRFPNVIDSTTIHPVTR